MARVIPGELRDIAEVVKRECKSLEDLWFKVQVVRTRPYSRLAAIVFKSKGLTLKEVCEKGPGEPPYSEIGVLYRYVSKLGVCNKERVVIYRGGSEILPGDWVALERSYAELYGPVYTLEVSPEDVVWAGTEEREWYYVPRHLQGYFKSIEDFWEAVLETSRGGEAMDKGFEEAKVALLREDYEELKDKLKLPPPLREIDKDIVEWRGEAAIEVFNKLREVGKFPLIGFTHIPFTRRARV